MEEAFFDWLGRNPELFLFLMIGGALLLFLVLPIYAVIGMVRSTKHELRFRRRLYPKLTPGEKEKIRAESEANRRAEVRITEIWRKKASAGNQVSKLGTQYPTNWEELAKQVRLRDGYKCANCGAKNVELHVHHIVPRSKGGTDNLSNLKTLCRDCHKKIHPHMKD